jgi:hypothetical protein
MASSTAADSVYDFSVPNLLASRFVSIVPLLLTFPLMIACPPPFLPNISFSTRGGFTTLADAGIFFFDLVLEHLLDLVMPKNKRRFGLPSIAEQLLQITGSP